MHVAVFFAVMRLDDVKNEVAVGTRILAARVPDDPNKFVVKGRGYAVDSLSTIRPEDLVVCDLEAFLVDGPPAEFAAIIQSDMSTIGKIVKTSGMKVD